MITAPEVSLVSISEIRGVLHPYRGAKRELLFIVIHSLMSKVDDEARCQFSVKRFPWQNTGENCDERSSNDELFFSSMLLCNSNGERKRAILFELLG